MLTYLIISLCWQISSYHWHWVDRVDQSIVARVDYFTLCWQRHIILLTKLIFDHDKKWWSIVDIHDWDYTEMRVHLPAEDMSIGICSSRQYPRQSGSSINYLPSILNWVPWRHQFFPRKCQFGKVSSITPRDFSTFQAKGSQWQDIHLSTLATPLQTAHADVQAEEGAAQHHGEGSGAAAASQIQAHICGRDGRGKSNIPCHTTYNTLTSETNWL